MRYLLILALGLSLRLFQFDTVPEPYATADEYAWTWSGMTLLSDGTPKAWSWFDSYTDTPTIAWHGAQFRIVSPWLDHPPLYSLFMGAWMRLGGYRNMFDAELRYMRVSSILLYIVTFALLAHLFLRTMDRPAATAALVAYSILPTIVIQSRLVLSENLLVVIALVSLIALQHHETDPRRRWLALLALSVFLLPLTKTAGLALVLAFFSLCVSQQRWRQAGIIVLAALAGVGVHLLYGMYYDSHLFFRIMHSQSARFAGFGSAFRLLFDGKIGTGNYVAMPIILGVLILFAELLQGRMTVWALMVVIYALGLAFFSDQRAVLGWYAIPLFPAIAAGLGRFAIDLRNRASEGHVWLAALFFLAGPLDALLGEHAAPKTGLRVVYLAAIVLLPIGVVALRRMTLERYQACIATVFGVEIMNEVYRVLVF